jgi:hypothetical protein
LARQHGGDMAPDGGTTSFDVTGVLLEQAAQGLWSGGEVKVTFVPDLGGPIDRPMAAALEANATRFDSIRLVQD